MNLTHTKLVAFFNHEVKADRKSKIYQRAEAYFNALGYLLQREQLAMLHLKRFLALLKAYPDIGENKQHLADLDAWLKEVLETEKTEEKEVDDHTNQAA